VGGIWLAHWRHRSGRWPEAAPDDGGDQQQRAGVWRFTLEWYSKTPMGKLAQTCIRLAWRDLLAERWRTLAHLGIIALSVMSYVGIRSSEGVLRSTRSTLSQRTGSGPLHRELDYAGHRTVGGAGSSARRRSVWTLVTSTTFEAGSDAVPDTVAAVLKAVDPDSYPLYGEVELEPKQAAEPGAGGKFDGRFAGAAAGTWGSRRRFDPSQWTAVPHFRDHRRGT